MASQFREITLEVSADLVRRCPGLAMDIGGSVAKIVYRSKDDWKELEKQKDAKTGKLRLLSCSRTLLDEAMAKVKAECHISRHGDEPTEIFTCGIGCSQFGPKINKMLNVKLSNVMEMDCFVKSFKYLTSSYTCNDLLKPELKEEIASLKEQMEHMRLVIEAWRKKSTMSTADPTKASSFTDTSVNMDDMMASKVPLSDAFGEKMFPCLLAMLGSAFCFMKINEDGSFMTVNIMNRGGRTMLGFSSLLSGAKTYDEIVDLAERGNNFAIDMSNLAFKRETEGDSNDEGTDVYGELMDSFGKKDESLVFSFGHAVGKDISEFKREDLAAAAVNLSINDTVHMLHKTALTTDVKQVFVCGSYTNRDYIRSEFVKEWVRRDTQTSFMTNMSGPGIHFLKAGSHFGALGALINNVDNFITRDGNIAPPPQVSLKTGLKEIPLEVSADLVRMCPGLSIDIGGSVIKVVYRSKTDWQDLLKDQNAKTGKLRLLSCSRTLLDEAMAKVKAECHISRHGDEPTEIFTCGIGCSQFGPKINKMLNVKLSNVVELDCFVRGFKYLIARHSCEYLLKPQMTKVIEEIQRQVEETMKGIDEFKELSNMDTATHDETLKQGVDPDTLMASEKPLEEAFGDDMYPCLVAMLGSGFGFLKIDKDGSFIIKEISNRGGRTFLALGCLLTGCKTYEDIVALAVKGNQFAVDVSQKAFYEDEKKENQDNGTDVYRDALDAMGKEESLTFALGHGVGKSISDFKKEDLAAAVVNLSVNDTVMSLHKTMVESGCKQVFVCGSYASHDYIRQEFTKEWVRRENGNGFMVGKSCGVNPYFVKAGGHLGALGALLNNIENFINKDGKKTDATDNNTDGDHTKL